MKSKYLISSFSFMVAMLCSFIGNAQPIKPRELFKKTDAALNDIQTVVYKIKRTDKYFASKDTVQRTAVCSLYIAPKDEMKAYHIVDVAFDQYTAKKEPVYIYRKYDGKNVLWNSYYLDSLDINKNPKIYNIEQEGISIIKGSFVNSLLLSHYFGNKRAFRQNNSIFNKIFIEKMEVKEGFFMNKPAYILTAQSKNLEKMSNYVDQSIVIYYIRKSDFLPIGYKEMSKLENMIEYNYYEIDYLDINPDIPLEAFKVDENESINAKERYRNFKEKIKN